jgi:hypothetical protein
MFARKILLDWLAESLTDQERSKSDGLMKGEVTNIDRALSRGIKVNLGALADIEIWGRT